MFGKQNTTEKFSRLEFSTDEAELRVLRVMTEANDTMLKLKQITPDEHQKTLQQIIGRLEVLEKKYERMDNVS